MHGSSLQYNKVHELSLIYTAKVSDKSLCSTTLVKKL